MVSWSTKKEKPKQTADQDIEHILSVYEAFEDESGTQKVVSMEEIRENDYNLNIRRYADTSPPPEQFDVKAILRGGIPVSEVEDEYIQETLQGMDVSCVFVRRDNEYYDFKPEIETRNRYETTSVMQTSP